ncbi:serine/threonine-protein kinase ATM [Anopheles funestus]|uniref:serine/threonine-protein kinase ATM n=1 Tax=Anopheles funestus TaxID=62324 RepID=UPI0020C5E010|nr:serine/threonine-protein kinase ATM [Anopheles funestus]XP_049286369.1 serine/threonine-protein kinase ATM [Anopheles funestus]
MSSSTSGGSTMTAMDRDLCSLLTEMPSEKVTVRQKAFIKMNSILTNREEDFLAYMQSDSFETAWSELFYAAYNGIRMQSATSKEQTEGKKDEYFKVLNKLTELAMDRVSPQLSWSQLIGSFVDAVTDHGMRAHFEMFFVNFLKKFVLSSKWCLSTVTYEQWKDIFDSCFVILDSSPTAKYATLNCLSLGVVKFLNNCSKTSLLDTYLTRFMDHIQQMVNEQKVNVLLELIDTASQMVQAIAVDCRIKTIQFLESLVPCTVKIYKKGNLRNEQKTILFRLMHLSLIILYPQGKSLSHAKKLTKDYTRAFEDDEVCRKTLREYHFIVMCEMKTRNLSASQGAKAFHGEISLRQETQLCDGFIDFAARLCYTVFWNEDNWKEGSRDETVLKRNKQFNKLQSVLDMIGTGPNHYNTRGLFILSTILDRYEAAICAEEYMPVLHLLCNIQPTLQTPMEHNAFYQCCIVLLNFEQKSTYRSLVRKLKGEQIELWNKIIAAAFRGCTNTSPKTSSDSNLLLQLLIRHRKYPSVSFLNDTVLEAFYTYAVPKTNINVGTVLCILDTVGSVECLGNVDDVLTKLFNYLYPQTRETQTKAIMHAKERLSANTLAHILILCVVTKRSPAEKDKIVTKKEQRSVLMEDLYREQDKQMQMLEQMLRLHSLEDLITLDESKNQPDGLRAAAERIYFNINEPLFLRLCELVSFDNHILPVDDNFLIDGMIRICHVLELYLQMLNLLLVHEAYNEERCSRSPLYKKILIKFGQLNQGFEKLLQNDTSPNENDMKSIAERLLTIFHGPYHRSVKKLLQETEHTNILRWTIERITITEHANSQCVTVLQADQLSSEQRWHRCLHSIIAEYLQYDGPCTDDVHDLLDRMTLNVYSSLDLFYTFDLCRILLKQTSHEFVAKWVLIKIVEICKIHYTDPAIAEMIIDLYADLTSFVRPYEELTRNVTVVLCLFVKQCSKHLYSVQLQVKIFAQVKYLLKAYPQHIRTQTHDGIYNSLIPLLSSSSYWIKLEGVKNILHCMKSDWAYNDVASIPSTYYQFQTEQYDKINFNELVSSVSGEDERVNVISCCLQLLLGILRTSFMLRRRALNDCVLLIHSGNVNDDKMAITMRIACSTGDIDFRKLLQIHLDSVLELWLTKGNRLLHFPYRLSGKMRSIEEFVQLFKKNIAYVILCMQPEQFEQFCKSIGVQQTEMVKSILPKCVSFLLPKYAKCEGMASKYSVMAGRMHNTLAPFLNTVDLKEHVTEIIIHLTYRLNENDELGKLADLDLHNCLVDDLSITKATYSTALEHLKQSVWGTSSIKYTVLSNLCLKNSSSIERTLMEVKRWLWAAEEHEQKMIHLFQYTVLLDHLKEYINQQKERSFKPYLVRDVVYFLCNLLVSVPSLRLATLNSMERFLANVVTSTDASELLSEHLHFIVSTLLEIESVDLSSKISNKSLALLRFLILEHESTFANAIGKLNYLPNDERFNELRLMISRRKTAGHESLLPSEEIAALIELPNLRYEDLAALKILLTTKKKELKMLCIELSDQSASSTNNGESVLHRLIYILLEVVRNSPFDKRSIEALRCLGEIGPVDLGTMLLKTDAEMIAYDTVNNTKEAIERCVDVLLREMDLLLTSKNITVGHMASQVCYTFLYGKTYRTLAAKLPTLHPFVGNSPEEVKLFTYTAGRELVLNTILGDKRLDYHVFVQQLSAVLLSFLGNTVLKKLAEQETTVAEKIVPLLVQIVLKQFEEKIIKNLGNFVNEFFTKFDLARSDAPCIFNDPKAIQLMLTIVECARIHNQLFPQYKVSVNYLSIAQASQFCQAHFKAILYGELWYREEEQKEKGAGKKNPALLNIMKACHLAIGDNDAVKPFLNPLHEQMEYYRLNQNYAQCLVMQDATLAWRGNTGEGTSQIAQESTSQSLLQQLKDSCLYGLARSLHVADQIDYECAWRLSDWNVVNDVIDNPGPDVKQDTVGINVHKLFERSHYTALKCLHLRDELAVESAIVDAQRAISEIFKLTSIESTKCIYQGLCRLRMLQQIEDFGGIHFAKQIDCEPDMLQKWKEQDELPHSEFKLMECILSQRLSILSTASIRAKRKWVVPAVYSTMLLLIHESRLRGYDDCAIRNVALIGREKLPANIQSIVLLEKAQLNWTSGHRLVARELVWEVMNSTEYNNPMVKAVACRLYGEFQAEGHLQEIKSLCVDYFQQAEKCVNFVLAKEKRDHKTVPDTIPSTHRCFDVDRSYTVQHTVAKYADREFVRLSKFFRSQEWEARKTNLVKMEEEATRLKAEAARATDQRRKDLGRSLHFMHKNLLRDKKAAEEVEQTRWDYLHLALCYYLKYAKQTTIVSDLVIFRIISLWLNNQENKNVRELIEESLLTVPSYKFIAVLPQLTPRVGIDSDVGALVQKVLIRCARDHPHHTLPFVFAQLHAFKDQPDHETPANDNRLLGVREVYKKLNQVPELEKLLQQTERMNLALIELANKTLSTSPSFREYTMTKKDPLGQLENLDLIHCPTVELPVMTCGNYRGRNVGIKRWDPKVIGVGGINAPKKLYCLCLNGTKQTQLLKGKDDMRQDAVMQQVFGILNILLRHDEETAHRKLSVRTYKVVPLSRQSGILEWCNNTMPIGAWLLTGHVKYRPQDIEPSAARKKFTNNAQAGMTVEKKLQNYLDICNKIQPVFRHYFLEEYLKPGVWFERQQKYIKSVAANSMIGYVLGIGDRHVQNILIDKLSGEVIHIDFGIAFEMGKNLPTPETVPFRLTRDIVDGMGISGVEGVFRKSCEKTLEVLRNNQTVILAILEVLLYDPLYSWNVLSNKKADRRQQQAYLSTSADGSDGNEPVGFPIRRDINVTAERTLMQVEEKLLGQEDNKYISVEGQVQMLIFNATNDRNLCQLFAGWQPYL